MSIITPSPTPIPRPAPLRGGPAGARPAGPAGIRPAGGAGSHPGRGRGEPDALSTMAHRRRLATAFVELFLEVEAGCRPSRHLAPLLAPMLYARLTRVWYRGGRPGQVISVSVIGDGPDGFDAIAVVRRGARSGAVSLRVARSGDRWRVAELARPEDGALPAPAYPVVLNDGEDDDAEIPTVILRGAAPVGGAGAAPDRAACAPAAEADWLQTAPAG